MPLVVSEGGSFSPRIIPRPAYPPVKEFARVVFKEVIVQAGVHGPLACLALFPLYKSVCAAALPAIKASFPASLQPEAVLFTVFISSVHTLLWALCNFSLLAFDAFGLFQRFKIGRKPFEVADRGLLTRMFVEAAVSQLVTGPLLTYFLYSWFVSFGMGNFLEELPSFEELSKVFIIVRVAPSRVNRRATRVLTSTTHTTLSSPGTLV